MSTELAEAANRAASGETAVTVAEEKPVTILDILNDPNQAAEIGRALPPGVTPDRFVRVATTAIKRNPKLLECTVQSLMTSIHRAAQLGLEPNTDLQHCWLLPFEDKKKGVVNVQFILGYRGILALARRSPSLLSVEAREVYSNDEFRFAYGTGPEAGIYHVPALTDRGELVCFYVVAKFRNSGYYYNVVDMDTIERHRMHSQTGKYNKGPWKTDYDAMARKTAIRIAAPYLDLTSEAAHAIAVDDEVIDESTTLDYIDAEVVPEELLETSVSEPDADEGYDGNS